MSFASVTTLLSIEIGLLIWIVALFFIRLYGKNIGRSVWTTISIVMFLFLLSRTPFLWNIKGTLFHESFLLDRFSVLLKGFFLIGGIGMMWMLQALPRNLEERSKELFIIFGIGLLGACFLVSANDFLVLFLSIELITFSLYIATTYWTHSDTSLEAGSKYLIMGAFSSAILLYGISFLYGAVGDLSFSAVRAYFAQTSSNIASLGVILVFAGLGFKVSIFPFHLWVPDVYQGSPTPATAFLAIISKSAGFAALIRVFTLAFGTINDHWALLIALLAAATLLYGNLGAIPQMKGDFKRLIAFSSIGHAGFLLMAFACRSVLGLNALLYYLLVYVVASITIFLSLILASQDDHHFQISSFRGLFMRAPIMGIALFLAFLSLAGVPPLAGFFGKFLVLQALVEQNILWLAFLGALSIGISLYYYLSIIRTIYIEPPSDPTPLKISLFSQAPLILLSFLLITMGIFQAPILHVISLVFIS